MAIADRRLDEPATPSVYAAAEGQVLVWARSYYRDSKARAG